MTNARTCTAFYSDLCGRQTPGRYHCANDGLLQYLPCCGVPVQGQPVQLSAAMFICETVAAHPGRVTLLALASLTNVAMAMKHDPTLAGNLVRPALSVSCEPSRIG